MPCHLILYSVKTFLVIFWRNISCYILWKHFLLYSVETFLVIFCGKFLVIFCLKFCYILWKHFFWHRDSTSLSWVPSFHRLPRIPGRPEPSKQFTTSLSLSIAKKHMLGPSRMFLFNMFFATRPSPSLAALWLASYHLVCVVFSSFNQLEHYVDVLGDQEAGEFYQWHHRGHTFD